MLGYLLSMLKKLLGTENCRVILPQKYQLNELYLLGLVLLKKKITREHSE